MSETRKRSNFNRSQIADSMAAWRDVIIINLTGNYNT